MSNLRSLARAVPAITMFANTAVDLLLPNLALAVLAPIGLSAALRLTIGGTLLAGKAFGGPLVPGQFRWQLALTASVLPVIVLVGCHFAGLRDTRCMVAAALAAGAICLGDLLRTRLQHRIGHHIDGLAMLVLAEVATSIVVASISGDARFVSARGSLYVAVAGTFFLASACTARPFMRDVLKPVAAQGNPERAAAFDRAWQRSMPFRAVYRSITAALGCVLLADAALRVIVVYSRPAADIAKTGLAGQLPGIALFALWFLIGRQLVVPRALRILEAEIANPSTAPAPFADR
jgi:hypothetical protein